MKRKQRRRTEKQGSGKPSRACTPSIPIAVEIYLQSIVQSKNASKEILNIAIIDFSAQFGGRDAAAVVLPHFKALKAAAKEIIVSDFPYPELSFILRVDGEVNRYGFSGTGNPDVDPDGTYLSIDIGITLEDRGRIISTITSGILNSPQIIDAAVRHQGIDDFDVSVLTPYLKILCERYEANILTS